MPKFDSATKYLVDLDLVKWVARFEKDFDSAEPLDSNLSTVAAEADSLIKVNRKKPYILHFEFQSSYESGMAKRFSWYNENTSYHNDLPVRTIIFLLRREADGPVMRQPLHKNWREEKPYRTFDFEVVRLWEEPVESYLEGGLGFLPLAPLCAVSAEELPEVIRRMEERIEEAGSEASTLWTAAFVLMGLKYSQPLIDRLMKGVRKMKDSVTYQWIVEQGIERGIEQGIEQGRARGERELILALGGRRFGDPSPDTLAQLEAIASPEQLKGLGLRLLEVESWSELLAGL